MSLRGAGRWVFGLRLALSLALLALAALLPPSTLAIGLVTTGAQDWRATDLWTGGSPPVPDSFGWAVAAGDFDGDGFRDVAIADPTATVGAVADAGVVTVLYGAPSGLASTGTQRWQQGASGVPDVPETSDWFGYALAAGDFDGDGHDDLAIGTPLENDGALANSGSVQVLYGSAAGLTGTGAQDWHQNVAGVPDTNESDDLFGWSMAAGDFDGDGYDDLAIGDVSEDLTVSGTGQVIVLYGSAAGLFAGAGSTQAFAQGVGGVPGNGELSDFFGEVLSSGDYDGDGYADLAIGVPNENVYVSSGSNEGDVVVLPGSASGLTATGSATLSQLDLFGFGTETPEVGDEFGAALASGDFDGDGRDELAVGAPGEDGGEGRAHVFEIVGSAWGVQEPRLDQDRTSIPGTGSINEAFGAALAAADFDGDGYADLAIGVPYDDGPNFFNGGTAHVLYGGPSGVSTTGSQYWQQSGLGIGGVTSETGDGFGRALAAGDFNADGADDLAVGVPFEALAATPIGAVDVIYSIGLCPNGVVDPGEECDDDNLTDEDGCSSVCVAEYCGDSVIQPGLGENCDDGNAVAEDGCSDVCVAEYCGDGVTQAGLGESCDDGNNVSEDGCSDVCVAEYCGDGVVQAGLGETCDDSNTTPGDGCSAACWPELGSADLYGWSMGGSLSITIAGVTITLSTTPGQSAAEILAALEAAILAEPTLSGLGVQVAIVGGRIYVSLAAAGYAIVDLGLSQTASTAVTTPYTDAAAFTTGLSGPGLTQDFDALVGGDPVGALGLLTFATAAPVEPPRATQSFETSSAPLSLGIDNLDEALLDGDPLYVALAQPADAIGLRIVTSDPALLDELRLVTPVGAGTNASVAESSTADGGFVYFVGLVSDTPFSSVVLGFDDDGETNFVYTVDDVTTRFVPEPGFELSLGAGLAFLVWAERRRRRDGRGIG